MTWAWSDDKLRQCFQLHLYSEAKILNLGKHWVKNKMPIQEFLQLAWLFAVWEEKGVSQLWPNMIEQIVLGSTWDISNFGICKVCNQTQNFPLIIKVKIRSFLTTKSLYYIISKDIFWTNSHDTRHVRMEENKEKQIPNSKRTYKSY